MFLSHNSAGKPAVEELLACRLVQAGLSPFLDIWRLIPREPFQAAIEEAPTERLVDALRLEAFMGIYPAASMM